MHPLSGTFSEFFVPGHPIGLSIIEALDTLYVMELDQELAAGVQWIEQNLSFDIDGSFHVFEAIIRVVGGLLAGYLATGNRKLLALTVDITDRLLPAFTKSPTGMPYQFVNLRTGEVSGNTPPLAEIGTNILEFGLLSRITGDPKYFDAAMKAFQGGPPRGLDQPDGQPPSTWRPGMPIDRSAPIRPRLVLRVPVGRLGDARQPAVP